MENLKENVIEWIKDEDAASLTLTQNRHKTRIEYLAKKYPKDCKILNRNNDGSIFAHVPLSWIKINPPRNLSNEQRKNLADKIKDVKGR